ncbi:MAG: hypothetical protein JO053_13110 [Acidobacteria bacterium]|nr:hypothetical protein [Acidobacteriota bacterium]
MTRFAAFAVIFGALSCACSRPAANTNSAPPVAQLPPSPEPAATVTPGPPKLQAELLDNRDKTTTSPIGKFDFKNYTYELPRGWQNPDGSTDITLVNGRVAPKTTQTDETMDPDEKALAKSERRIGMSYVTTKFLDMTGDGQDEAVVILKIETEGSAIPQVAYVFAWKDWKPELIWPFRTGDRADGGLKDIRVENGLVVVELYGQDRFILGQTETSKVTGDEEQLCCPLYFTRSFYKWNGNAFLMQGKRLTYPMGQPNAIPEENVADRVNNPQNANKKSK